MGFAAAGSVKRIASPPSGSRSPPEPAAVGLDEGAPDREPHAEAAGLGGVELGEHPVTP